MKTICTNKSVKLEAFCVVHAYGELTIQSTQFYASDPRDRWSLLKLYLDHSCTSQAPKLPLPVFNQIFCIFNVHEVFLSLAVGRMWDELAGNRKYHSPEAVGITESLLMK